ncbi:uncharacterized protein LOC116009931 [Ipomoea triloba]|uniref:uncharacterized protein LOC116009931 n=1 Tax=Ipomoea triloba TaxID=35885 RepID=UPI00125E2FBC|nr:uncharacterized protein LOC116009931 [Ipomoea triloba]
MHDVYCCYGECSVHAVDYTGDFFAAKNGNFHCHNDVHLAESMAVKEALSWAKDRAWLKIRVLSDCQSVCNLINGSSLDHSYAGCVIDDCKALQRHFEVVSIGFIPRSVNKLAHAVARAASSQPGPNVWFSSIPSCISHLV